MIRRSTIESARQHGPFEDRRKRRRADAGSSAAVHHGGRPPSAAATARQSYQYVDVLTGMVELSQNRRAAVRAVRGRVDGAGGLPVGRACGLLSETVDNRFEIGQTIALRESAHLRGDVAQLGEHHVRNVGVVGSNPIISTTEMTRASGDRGPLCFAVSVGATSVAPCRER